MSTAGRSPILQNGLTPLPAAAGGPGSAPLARAAYTLPDGTSVELSDVEAASVPELIFDPSRMRTALPGAQPLHQTLLAAATAVDPDARRELLANMVLVGGASVAPSTHERLLHEFLPISPGGLKAKLHSAASAERRHGAWLGGSILGSLGGFPELWFSAQEYAEHGAKFVHVKSP